MKLFKTYSAPLIISALLLGSQSVNAEPKKLGKKPRRTLITDIPKDYEKLDGCKKQEFLWKEIEDSKHSKLPKFEKMNVFKLVGMGFQSMTKKVEHAYDVAPDDWKKYLHRRGAVAKVKIVASPESNLTGVFQGAECALLRLSLTYKPTKKRDVAPGLALKVLRDKMPSANVSALYTLEGQGKNYNFFKNPLSNIVPIGSDIGLKLVHSIFKRVTDYPEQLGTKDMASFDSEGNKIASINSPKQIFFVPTEAISKKFSDKKHDVREDFLTIDSGTVLYKIYSVDSIHKDFNYHDYSIGKMEEFLKDSTMIGEVVMTSPFVASEFGDTKIFFKHQTAD
ncbi:MAG: hypothetical protein ACJAT2_000205 [Bacteriovoracaceae bacterium]|jgi:hypothetical protein